MIQFGLLLNYFWVILSSNTLIEAAKFDVFVKSLRCYEINPKALTNTSCILKVTREKPTGLVFLKGTAMGVSDFNFHYIMYYRYTGGFKPYLLDLVIDVCPLMKQTSAMLSNGLVGRFMVELKGVFKDIFKGCPYAGVLESGWIDGNATFTPVLPPILPQGRYKFVHRLSWHKNNETICIIEYQIDFKPRKEFRDMDFSMLNMG